MVRFKNSGLVPLLLLGLVAGLTPAWAADYPTDMIKKYPKSLHAFQKLIPKRWVKVDWIYQLNGTAIPVQELSLDGKKCFLGRVCRPHFCGGNDVTFLLSADGTTAFARVNSETLTNSKDVLLGQPPRDVLKLLVAGPNPNL